MGVEHGVTLHLLVAGQADYGAAAVEPFRPAVQGNHLPGGGSRFGAGIRVGAGRRRGFSRRFHVAGVDHRPAIGNGVAQDGGTAQVGDLIDCLACGQPVGQRNYGTLGVAVEQDVRLAVHQGRVAHLLLPVVEVGDAPQRGLNAADDHGHPLAGFLAALAVDQNGPVGAPAALGIGGVGVVGTDLPVRGVAVHHGVHVARGDAEEEVGAAQLHEIVRGAPVGLGDDSHAEALGLEQPSHDGHAEAGVVHVGIAGDDDDVAAVPAQLLHLLPAHGQEGRGSELVRPVSAVAEDIF